MKVYLVWQRDVFNDKRVIAAFKSQQKAEDCQETLQRDADKCQDNNTYWTNEIETYD